MDEILYLILQYAVYIIYVLLFFGIIKLLFGAGIKFYHSHWNTLINNFEYSTEEFYLKFKKELLSHGISGITASNVSLHEGNIFSSKRRYIRVKWKEYQYDICASPFGDGFFVSWWLLNKMSWMQVIISIIPFVGPWIVRKLFTITYYRIDTASMLMSYAQASVLKVIEEITDKKGVRAMTDDERKPILNDIFKR